MATLVTSDTLAPPAVSAPRLRLDFLDGLRGLAALYVLLYHGSVLTMELSESGNGVSHWMARTLHFTHFYLFNYGLYAVAVFILLSGYCLMLPVARNREERISGGFWEFMRRRSRRILPPYFAAALLCLLFLGFAGRLGIVLKDMSWYPYVRDSFSVGSLASHLLLLHVWTPWRAAIDPPMWSVSVEWQIYFLFPLVLLPIYRRLGILGLLVIAFGIGVGPHYLGASSLDKMHPWFISLFAVGMAGAAINFSGRPQAIALRDKLPWASLAVFCGLLTMAVTILQKIHTETSLSWIAESLAGIMVGCIIIHEARRIRRGDPDRTGVLELLASRPLVRLGDFSYSLYLVHIPVIETIWYLIARMHLNANVAVTAFVCTALPLGILLSYLFHLVFERRFLPGHLRTAARSMSIPA